MAYTPFLTPGGQDLTPNAFGSVGGNVATQQVISAYQQYKPNELVQLFERHGYRPSFRLMLKTMGFNRGTFAPTTGHYEAPWRKNLVTIGSIITPSGGPGTVVVVELDAGDMYNAGVTVSGVAASASYPIENEILKFPDGNSGMIITKDTSVIPHRLTIKPLDSAVDLVASIVVGESYFIATNAWGEGTGLPGGRVPRIIKYTNEFQIVKEAAASTGTELTNMMYFEPVEGQSGSLFMKIKTDSMYRFEENFDGALLWGQPINNISIFNSNVGHDVDVKGTEGFEEYASVNGNNETYTIGNYQMSDFDDYSRYYEGERVGQLDMIQLMGIDLQIEVENVLGDLLNGDLAALLTERFLWGDGIFMDQFAPKKDVLSYAMAWNFRAVHKGGFNYFFYKMNQFNENVGAGSSSYDYKNRLLMFPVGYTTEKSSGEARATIGYEYKAIGSYSREEVIADISGVGVAGSGGYRVIASSENDIHKLGMLSEMAFHGTCANHVTYVTPS